MAKDITLKQLEKLYNFGGDCDCDYEDREGTVNIIHNGEWNENFDYCVICGGVVF